MTDRRRQGFLWRLRRRLHTRLERFKGWATATGIIPRWQFLLVYLLVVASALVGQWQISTNSNRNTEALCALRDDVAKRLISSSEFLREHPEGALGIPPATIRQSIANYEFTVDALADLDCAG